MGELVKKINTAEIDSLVRNQLQNFSELDERQVGSVIQTRIPLVRHAPDDADLNIYRLVYPQHREPPTLKGLAMFEAKKSQFIGAGLWARKWRPQGTKRPTQHNFRKLYSHPFGDYKSVAAEGSGIDSQYESLLGLEWAVNLDPLNRLCAVRVEVGPRERQEWEWRRGLVLTCKEKPPSKAEYFNVLAYLVDYDVFAACRGKDLRWLPISWTASLPPNVQLITKCKSVFPSLGSPDGVPPPGAVDGRALVLVKESLVEGLSRVLGNSQAITQPHPLGGVNVYKCRGMVERHLDLNRNRRGPLLINPSLFFCVPNPLVWDRAFFFEKLQSFYGSPSGPSGKREEFRIPTGVTEKALKEGTPMVAVAYLPICHSCKRWEKAEDEEEVCKEDDRIHARCWYRVRVLGYHREGAVLAGRLRPIRSLLEVEDVDAFAIKGVENVRFVVRARDLFWLTPALAYHPVPRYYARLAHLCPRDNKEAFSHQACLLLSCILLRHSHPRARKLGTQVFLRGTVDQDDHRRVTSLLRLLYDNYGFQPQPDNGFILPQTVNVIVTGERMESGLLGSVAVAEVVMSSTERKTWLNDFLVQPPDGGPPLAGDTYADPRPALSTLCNKARRLVACRDGLLPPSDKPVPEPRQVVSALAVLRRQLEEMAAVRDEDTDHSEDSDHESGFVNGTPPKWTPTGTETGTDSPDALSRASDSAVPESDTSLPGSDLPETEPETETSPISNPSSILLDTSTESFFTAPESLSASDSLDCN